MSVDLLGVLFQRAILLNQVLRDHHLLTVEDAKSDCDRVYRWMNVIH